MASNTTYTRPEGETTEWDDIQVKLGNKAPPEPVSKAAPFVSQADPAAKDSEWVQKQSEAVLEDLEDDFMDDPVLEQLRFTSNYIKWMSTHIPCIPHEWPEIWTFDVSSSQTLSLK